MAVQIARHASTQLREAGLLEGILTDSRNWNRASWTVWGGNYAGVERGGKDSEGTRRREGVPQRIADDGGWQVDAGEWSVVCQLNLSDRYSCNPGYPGPR